MRDTNIESISNILTDKRISIVSGGGIGAIEMPRVARELRRHGATVQFIVTQKCLEFVGMTSLEWSSQNHVVLEPSGLSEHICTSDAILIAPATTDIISHARYGFCNNGATTLIQSALGQGIPIGFVPNMHDSLWHSPILQESVQFLKKFENIFFINPRREEHKEKMPPPDQLALTFAHYVNKLLHKNKSHVLISLGGTRVMIDPVRSISNLSTGRLGFEALKLFYAMGHEITVIAAQTNFELQKYQDLTIHEHQDYSEVYEFFKNLDCSNMDGFFHFLAASDYIMHNTEQNKIESTRDHILLRLEKAPKIRDLKNLQNIPYKFFCKLTSDDDSKTQLSIKNFMNAHNVQTLLWNTPKNAWNKNNIHKGFFVTRRGDNFIFKEIEGKKEMAQKIYDEYTHICHPAAVCHPAA